MNKDQFDNLLELSFLKLKTDIKWLNLSKEEIANRIKLLLEIQTKDLQLVTQLKYVENLTISEISKVMNISEFIVYSYILAIISDINHILYLETKKIEEKKWEWVNSSHILDIKG